MLGELPAGGDGFTRKIAVDVVAEVGGGLVAAFALFFQGLQRDGLHVAAERFVQRAELGGM